MAMVTKQELIDASADCLTLETVVNGAASPGTLTSRLGTSLRTVLKVIADLEDEINTAGTGWLALAQDWAEKTNGVVDSTDYSAKAWSIGGTGVTATTGKGASKEWATKTSAAVDTTEFSAKEYAQGSQASTGGSSKNWAQMTGSDVLGAAANSRSAKSWAQEDLHGATLGGSAKDWAQSSSLPDGTLKSAKSYAIDAAASAAVAAASASVYTSILGWAGGATIYDGVTDATFAIVAFRNAYKAAIRSNPAPGANSNKLSSTGDVWFPAGDYLVTSAQAFLDSTFTTRTVGYSIVGTGTVQILYQPSVAGPLFYNNDAVLSLKIKNIIFNCNSSTSDFLYSNSTGGAQSTQFDNVVWGGTWQHGIHLVGSNSNSEGRFTNCTVSQITCTTFLYSETSDQFLNYWFTKGSLSIAAGTMFKMTKGGHLKFLFCDFSGYQPVASALLFSLEGTSHAQGVCDFVMYGCRFELKTLNAKVMFCQWPQGNVVFDTCDFSSQVGLTGASTFVTLEFQNINTAGCSVKFVNCSLMGIHKYQADNSTWDSSHSVVYDNCIALNFADFYDMFSISLTTGSNAAGLPSPIVVNGCRGASQGTPFQSITGWAATTAYVLNDIRRTGNWVYKCTTAGTSGSTAPFGSGVVTDGTVTWTQEPTYMQNEFVTEGRVSIVNSRTAMLQKKIVKIGDTIGRVPSRTSASVPNTCRVILPPNSTVVGVYIDIQAGSSAQTSQGTLKAFSEAASPTTFFNSLSTNNMNLANSWSWTGVYRTGSTLGGRSISIWGHTDVTQIIGSPGGQAWVEYF